MTKTQIATWLNNYVMKNEIVDQATWSGNLAEDLSNFADFGTKVLGGMSSQALLNLKNNLIVTIKNETIKRVLESKDFGMVKNNAKFRATIQRIMASGLYATHDSHRTNLDWNSGNTWMDGRYFGISLDAALYTKSDAFKVINSISDAEWEQALGGADELADIISLIEITVENTITANLNALVKRLYCTMIDNCEKATTPRVIQLVTEFSKGYNPNHSTTPYTLATIKANRDLNAMFNAFVKATISKVVGYVQEMNKVYNDGSVIQFTPADKIEIVMLNDFVSDITFMTDPIEYHNTDLPTYKKINAWQSTGDEMYKSLADVSTIVVDEATGPDTTYTNVVGIIYDTDGVGITTLDGGRNTTVEYVGSEGFTNYHHHIENRYFVDTRLASVVLELA